mgnify:CR=1 FL=1
MKKYMYLSAVLVFGFSMWATAASLKAEGDVYVRQSPPSGLFCSRGKELGMVKKGQVVKKIEDVKAVCGLFFYYNYYKIEFKDTNGLIHQAYVSQVDHDGSTLFSEVE